MIRLLLGGTALTAVLITGALAQSSSSAMESSAMSSSSAADNSATSSSAMMDSSAMSSQMSTASSMDSSMMSSAPTATSTTTTTTTGGRTQVNILSGYTQADTDHLASKIIGSPVYDGTGDKANNLGKITDFIVNENGNIAAVIVGVGGFLGIGEKQVAVDFGALQWTVASDNTHRFVLQTTKDQLTSAPDFKTVDASSASAAPSGSTEPATSSTSMDVTASSSAAQ